MAIIKCPECGKDISEKATHCIHCGYPIKPRSAQPVQIVHQEGCFLKTLNAGCLVVVVIVVLIIFSAIFSRF